jgi:hypothetical protein
VQPCWVVVVVGCTRSLPRMQLVRIVTLPVVGNSETPHRCNTLIEHLSAVMFVRHYL